MTLTEAARAAIRAELDRRRAVTDASTGLHTLTITLKFVAGTDQVRGVAWQEESLAQSRRSGG